VRIYPDFLAHCTVPQQTAYRSKKYQKSTKNAIIYQNVGVFNANFSDCAKHTVTKFDRFMHKIFLLALLKKGIKCTFGTLR
jgi:hypothetical protein